MPDMHKLHADFVRKCIRFLIDRSSIHARFLSKKLRSAAMFLSDGCITLGFASRKRGEEIATSENHEKKQIYDHRLDMRSGLRSMRRFVYRER